MRVKRHRSIRLAPLSRVVSGVWVPGKPLALSPVSRRSPDLLNVVANKQYIDQLQMVIRQLHNCDAEHVNSEPVKETYQGETVWEGEVEVFTVKGHPRAQRAYAWSYNRGSNNETFTAVLEIPPVKSALDAVKVSIIAATKKQYKE